MRTRSRLEPVTPLPRGPAAQHPKTAKMTSCCVPLRKVAASALHPGYWGDPSSASHPPPTLTVPLPLPYPCLLTSHSCGQLPTVACSSCFHTSSQADPPGAGHSSWPVEARGPVTYGPPTHIGVQASMALSALTSLSFKFQTRCRWAMTKKEARLVLPLQDRTPWPSACGTTGTTHTQ